jgi:sigma-B regulation protein RsbU (phosphoserine phosphatase)
MTLADLEHFRNLLIERQQNVVDWLESPAASRAEELHKAQELLNEIRGALARVENHSYGTCSVCQAEVELHRLEAQPLAQVCLGCISPEEQSQLEDDLFLANRIYHALLPHANTEIAGFDVAVNMAEARYVGGDYFDFLSPCACSPAHRVIVADIMGKGVAAGLMMSNVQGALRLLAETHSSPAKLVCNLNQWLCRNIPVTKFVSLVCLALENGSDGRRRMVYANAGHCSPILVRRNGTIEILHQTGAVIGVREDFEYTEEEAHLESGDLLVLYTDGIVEAANPQGDMYNEERLMAFLQPRRSNELMTLVADLITNVKAFAVKPRLEDDYIVLAIRKQ